MDPIAKPQSTAAATATSVDDRRPLKFLLLAVALLSARWIWIAGLGDYGWTYELGARILRGEVPYRDFISTLPQLTSYTITPFLAALKGNLWAFSLHLYAWWLAALLVGLRVATVFGLPPATRAAGLLFAACLSLPATHLGHAYSYAGTVCFGLTLLRLEQHRRQPSRRALLLAGAFAGLGLFAKQNIGIMALALGLVGLTLGQFASNRPRLPWQRFSFIFGAAAVFLPIFAVFAHFAGAGEVFRQMFSDASEGKGGLFSMIFHALPLYFFQPQTPLRELWILLFAGGLALGFFGFLGNRLYRAQQKSPAAAPTTDDAPSWRGATVALGIVVSLGAISLLDLPGARSVFNRLHPDAIYRFHGFVAPLVFIGYSFFSVLAAIGLFGLGQRRRPELILPLLALPLLLWGHELSCQGYLPFGAPVVVPLAMVLLERLGLIRNIVRLACVASVVLMAGVAASTQDGFQPPCFKSTAALPARAEFAGLRSAQDFAASARELNEHVAPKITGQTTLWISVGGPHLVWGGKPVFAVGSLFADTYNVRSEPVLAQRWDATPPEFIFVGQRTYCFGSRLFTTEALNRWLPQRYDPIWQSTEREASLWQLRKSTNRPAP